MITTAQNWPIGDGDTFQGVFDRASQTVHLFQRGDRRKKVLANIIDIKDPEIEDVIGHELYSKLLEDVEMLDSLIPPPDIDRIQVCSWY